MVVARSGSRPAPQLLFPDRPCVSAGALFPGCGRSRSSCWLSGEKTLASSPGRDEVLAGMSCLDDQTNDYVHPKDAASLMPTVRYKTITLQTIRQKNLFVLIVFMFRMEPSQGLMIIQV
jgi:hypothetical protein